MKKSAGQRREERYQRLLEAQTQVIEKANNYVAEKHLWRLRELLIASMRHGRLVCRYISGAVAR
jgi:hypothetical protein